MIEKDEFLSELRRREATQWREKLKRSMDLGPVNGPAGYARITIDGWDLHELYTRLVEPGGEEGCCAGCTILPPGWCEGCDRTRKKSYGK